MKQDISMIPQNPTDKQVEEYVESFTHALCNLNAIWGNANEKQSTALSNMFYPFKVDFDEVMHRTINWATEIRSQLNKGE